MTVARKNLVDSESPGFYHCTNRCVRRTFLCGIDKLTGNDFTHRKDWIEERILSLCDIFAVEIFAYAVMSNHFHLVCYVDPKAPLQWSDAEVAERWLQVYPSRLDKPENTAQREMKKAAIIDSPDKLKLYRKRLGDLSWYMRRLNEPLAKRCNKEENCTGRFWEDRYHSQALLDEGAVFACMAYVDLNPVRAKIADRLENSNHTGIKKRIESVKKRNNFSESVHVQHAQIEAVSGQLKSKALNIKQGEYIQLVEWAGQSIIYENKTSIPKEIVPILERLNLQQNNFLHQIKNMESNYHRAIGTMFKIREKANKLKVRCLHGISASKLLYIKPQ